MAGNDIYRIVATEFKWTFPWAQSAQTQQQTFHPLSSKNISLTFTTCMSLRIPNYGGQSEQSWQICIRVMSGVEIICKAINWMSFHVPSLCCPITPHTGDLNDASLICSYFRKFNDFLARVTSKMNKTSIFEDYDNENRGQKLELF